MLSELAPILNTYEREIEYVLTPYLTIGVRPNISTPTVSIDSRGYRFSRVDDATIASEDAPDDATFMLGGSWAFGMGAADDSGTVASTLWRRTGRPCVNLATPRGGSTHELISALPFATRRTTFFVCSGGNSFINAREAPLDPLFGASFVDYWIRKLRGPTVDQLLHMTWAARKGRPARWRPGPTPPRRVPKPSAPEDLLSVVATGHALQLRDLRAIRRLVPDDADVVFALHPVAVMTGKALTDEEKAIAEALAVLRPTMLRAKELVTSHWDGYAAALAESCESLGVRFVDLSKAPYTGWCFLDWVHMNNRGYEIAADFLLSSID